MRPAPAPRPQPTPRPAYAAALTAAEDAAAREQLAGVGEADPADYMGGTVFPQWSDVCPAGESEEYGPSTTSTCPR